MRRTLKLICLDSLTREFLASLKDRRINAGLTQRELGKQIGVGRADVQFYENGRYKPSLEILIKLADFFGCDLSESVNYKFFHRSLKPSYLKAKIKHFGFNYPELGRLIGYDKQVIFETIHYRKNSSVECMAAILDVLEQENARYIIRNSLLKKKVTPS